MSTTPRARATRARATQAPAASAKTTKASKPQPAKAAAQAAPASKPAADPVAKPAAKAEAKPPKKIKPVLVRDGFTMPEADFSLIAALKKRAAAAGREAKKSELLRAGLQALSALEAASLVKALNALEPVKVGRPRKGH